MAKSHDAAPDRFARDVATLDLTEQTVRLADELRFWPMRQRGQLIYRIECPSQKRFYNLGYEEYVFVSLLDGKTSIAAACSIVASRLGARAPSMDQAVSIVRWLLQHRLAGLAFEGVTSMKVDGGQDEPTSMMKRLNPFWMKFPIRRGLVAINRLADAGQSLLSPAAVTIAVITMMVGVLVFLIQRGDLLSSGEQIFHRSTWAWWLATWVGLKIIHESAHAIACRRQGGSVDEIGIVFVLLAPLVYVDVTSCWRMSSRRSRIYVAAAGMFAEWSIAAVAMIAWMVLPDAPIARQWLSQVIITAGVSTIVFNANVLMRFDGYFILTDLIEIPNLAAEGSASLARVAKRWLVGESTPPSPFVGWRRWFVPAYGLACLVWRVMVCVTLAIAASTMFAGAGIAIAAIGLTTWIGQPVHQICHQWLHLRTEKPAGAVRALVLGSLAITGLVSGVFLVPVPTSIRSYASVDYQPETLVRSRCDGMISQIHVRDGDVVAAGDALIELTNPELVAEHRQLKIKRQQNTIRLRSAIESRDDAMRLVLQQRAQMLDEQMASVQTKVDALKIFAAKSGTIIARALETKQGTFVREGDPIVTIAEPTDKEVIAWVTQQDLDGAAELVDLPVRVTTKDGTMIEATLQRIEPRASDRLDHPSLAATHGGPLAIRMEQENADALTLIDPHFRARIALDTNAAERLPAGSLLKADLGYQRLTIAQRIELKVAELMNAKR